MAAFTVDDLMFKPGLMSGQRILITGGGTGLGRVMAEACLMLGAEVIICGRRGAVLEETKRELTAAHGGTMSTIACDIRSADAVADMVAEAWAGAPVTGLVNNAAGNFISRTEDLSPRAFEAISNIVFRGSFFVTLECGKRWIAEGRTAAVLSILVTWIWNGGPFTVPSAMSKAGLHAMTQSLAVEWGTKGIRFNAIAPGPFPTEGMSARLNPESGGDQGDYFELARNPMGRVGDMRELANLAVYLLHPLSTYVNGQTIAIDGGAWQSSGGNFAGLMKWDDAKWSAARDAIQASNQKDRAARTV
jgi:NAD(P)-dependent dehydrogenase (short-subunit alcohol dehydrogenase family)